jgi:hypothetical protein
MLSINCQLFHNSPLLHVRDVTVRKNDDLPSHRQKLARIVLDEMYPFVGLLDANGNSLEINRAELDGAEIQPRPIEYAVKRGYKAFFVSQFVHHPVCHLHGQFNADRQADVRAQGNPDGGHEQTSRNAFS